MLDAKLETLLTIAETKNFTRAAEMLNLTQPAISNHIKLLEKELNCRLFVRNKTDLRLTEAGEIAVKYARRLKAINQRMYDEISNQKTALQKLRVGITHTSESNTIAEALASYGLSRESLSITIITDTAANLYRMMENYELDIAIVEDRRPSSMLNYLMLDTDYLVCVTSSDSPLAASSSITIEQLKHQQLILRLPTSATRQLFEAALTSIGETIDSFNIVIEVDNVSTIRNLVRQGMGVSILPISACLSDIKKGNLVALNVENLAMRREMNIVYARDYDHVDVLEDFVATYRRAIGK